LTGLRNCQSSQRGPINTGMDINARDEFAPVWKAASYILCSEPVSARLSKLHKVSYATFAKINLKCLAVSPPGVSRIRQKAKYYHPQSDARVLRRAIILLDRPVHKMWEQNLAPFGDWFGPEPLKIEVRPPWGPE